MSIAIDRPDTRSARRTRLVAEGVVAGYIHDLSAAAASPAPRASQRAGSSAIRAGTAEGTVP